MLHTSTMCLPMSEACGSMPPTSMAIRRFCRAVLRNSSDTNLMSGVSPSSHDSSQRCLEAFYTTFSNVCVFRVMYTPICHVKRCVCRASCQEYFQDSDGSSHLACLLSYSSRPGKEASFLILLKKGTAFCQRPKPQHRTSRSLLQL